MVKPGINWRPCLCCVLSSVIRNAHACAHKHMHMAGFAFIVFFSNFSEQHEEYACHASIYHLHEGGVRQDLPSVFSAVPLLNRQLHPCR